MSFSRSDRSLLARWWFTVDQSLLTAALFLFAIGLVVSLAASPAVADAKGLRPFQFVERHLLHALVGVVVMLAISLMEPRAIRRLALGVLLCAVTAMVVALIAGPELNGARRWISFGGMTLQPSEFAKPAFVVLAAWALSEHQQRPDMPGLYIAIGLAVIVVGALLLQPDIGQAVLITAALGALLVLAGLPLVWPFGVAVAGVALVAVAYVLIGYVQNRVNAFLSGEFVTGAQTERALRAFLEGGFWGRGPGAGTIKTDLADAHTDFIFAVIAEEYGIGACLGLVAIYAIIVTRLIIGGIAQADPAIRSALIGLAVIVGLQASVHMAVNVGLLPATGMTLPLISAGGSSMLAISATLGMGLALSRRRPQASRLKRTAFATKAAIQD